MKCAWDELLRILPLRLRHDVDARGKSTLQELRLRLGKPPVLIQPAGMELLQTVVQQDDLNFIVNTATRYSPWAAESAAEGYITAPGGHRIGLCGEAVIQDGKMTGIRRLHSLCIRVARAHPGIHRPVPMHGSVLILGPPGSGKTTFLRELIRMRSGLNCGSIAVVDERGELFPENGIFDAGLNTDVLTGCSKCSGMELLLKTMGPSTIAVDEITSAEDCRALLKVGWCGVSLLATAHAACRRDFAERAVYRPLADSRIFDQLIILKPDKSWTAERADDGQ